MNKGIHEHQKDNRFIRISAVLEKIPIGRSTWWKWVAEGKAPQPIKLGPRTTAWKAEDISKFMTQLEEQGRGS